MPKVVDTGKVQEALDRAARNAKRGSSAVRAGRFVAQRSAKDGRFATRNDKPSTTANPGPMRKG